MRNKWIILIVALIAISGIGYFVFKANTDRILAWQVEKNFEENVAAQTVDDDRLELIFCGTGSPNFQADRGQACLGVVAGGKLFLFDAGEGASQGLQAAKAPTLSLEAIFLTHLHSDHMSGLGDVLHNSWLFGRKNQVTTYGPAGTEQTLEGMRLGFAADLVERLKVIGNEYDGATNPMGVASDIEVSGDALVAVYDKDGVTISAFAVDHPKWVHAFGYKVTYRGKSLIISGDTRYSANLVKHAQNADVLVHEALNENMMRTVASVLADLESDTVDPERIERIINTHTPTQELARLASEAEVKRLIVTHLIPSIPANAVTESMFIDGMSDIYSRDITVARDGMRITILE